MTTGRVAMAAALLALMVAVPIGFHYSGGVSGIPASQNRFSHVVIIVMENHAYDNYFGTYCPALGPYCKNVSNGLPAGICIAKYPKNPSAGCVKPFPFSQVSGAKNLQHDWQSEHSAYDGGKMDNFYQAEGKSVQTFGYYTGKTIPVYWDLAEQYALGDNFYPSELSYSLPNHWHIVAGSSPPADDRTWVDSSFTAAHKYLNEANTTPTIQDLLIHSSVSWQYYDYALLPYSQAIGSLTDGVGSAYNFWNPMAGRSESYNPAFLSSFTNNTNFFRDVQTGHLPNVSWVIPYMNQSDHPPNNLTQGESFVSRIVNAVEMSPYWATTALFITWDEYGGYYDHVKPRQISPTGLSFRVPLLVVSAHTPEDVVVHQFVYFDSLLRFVEENFGLGCLPSASDCAAPLPTSFFDFGMAPRAPMSFAVNAMNAAYPMPLEP